MSGHRKPKFIDAVRRLRSDERGAFLVIFALMAVVLVATAGAVVDYTMVEQTRNRAQAALDSAALGLQPQIYSQTEEQLRAAAERLLRDRLADSDATIGVTRARTNTTDGQLYLEADISVPTAFVALVGVGAVPAKIISEATRRRINVEVAMVLDNSTSMNQSSRMTNLKAAANHAADILFSNQDTQPNVHVGVVPFTEFVNVGTDNRYASWIDQTGTVPLSRQNFDTDDDHLSAFTGAADRFGLYTSLGVPWKGCVEARSAPYDTNDTPPDASNPATMFVPAFAPDEPDTKNNRDRDVFGNSYLSDVGGSCTNNGSCQWQEVRTRCDRDGRCSGTTTVTATYTLPNGMTTRGASVCNCTSTPTGTGIVTITSDETSSTGNRNNLTFTRAMSCIYSPALGERELQERMCKYTGARLIAGKEGPNVDCPGAELLPLTNQRQAVKTRIGQMSSNGYTNIHQGAIWGLHMLSPTAPLTEAKAYGATTYKVMILMTDGENTHPFSSNINGSQRYVAYNYPYHGRLTGASEAELKAAMNTKTVDTCTEAKRDGRITIFTIGLNPPNDTTRQMLTDCASSPNNAYFTNNSADLTSIFQTIANQLSNLRLAQ